MSGFGLPTELETSESAGPGINAAESNFFCLRSQKPALSPLAKMEWLRQQCFSKDLTVSRASCSIQLANIVGKMAA